MTETCGVLAGLVVELFRVSMAFLVEAPEWGKFVGLEGPWEDGSVGVSFLFAWREGSERLLLVRGGVVWSSQLEAEEG